MNDRRLAGAPLDLSALRTELEVPGEFSYVQQTEARHAVDSVSLPDDDATDIPFVTVDPPGSRDLDQAVHLARDGEGYLVSYAIADVASFVTSGGALDDEAQRRGQTLYFPDLRIPLYPAVLSEGGASLLPDQIRPAILWQIRLDAAGSTTDIAVRHARVRSRAQLDYGGVQADLDAGRAVDAVALLPTIGALLIDRSRDRHAIELNLADQEVEADGHGGWRLVLRAERPVERWNAQISLLTGRAAATLMLEHRVGILRTLPPPEGTVVHELQQAALALGVDWPEGAAPGAVLAGVDPVQPRHAAFVDHATSLLRGAGYTAFVDGAPQQSFHAGVGAPYSHVTAPLRRLVDRFGGTLCLWLARGERAPDWITAALPGLPATMQRSDQQAHAVERAVVDSVEAWLLRDRVGETFPAVVLNAHGDSARIVIDDPVVRATCEGTDLQPGQQISVRLVAADVAHHTVRFVAV